MRISTAISLLCLLLVPAACADDGDQADDVLAEYDRAYRAENPYEDLDVERDGLALSARLFRASAAADGPPIILMHGYPDSQHLYDRVIPLLREERDVVSFDFIGWGNSAKPDAADHDYDADGLRRDLEAVIARLGRERVVLVVHDSSGWPGIDWALDHPERTAALVILNTVYHPSAEAMAPEGLAQYVGSSETRNALAARTGSDDDLWFDGDDSEGIIGYRWQLDVFMNDDDAQAELMPVFEAESLAMRPAFMELASRLLDEITARGPAIPAMQAFPSPVRIVFGTDDPYLGPGVAADFERLFPTSVRVDIAGAHHYVQIDAPQAVAEQILLADQD